MVGLIPLFAVETLEPELLKQLPEFAARLEWFLEHRPELATLVSRWQDPGTRKPQSAFAAARSSHEGAAARMLDETEFLSDYGVRAVSKIHEREPFRFETGGNTYEVGYWPAESHSGLFGGNSNWRGPIWMPVNYLHHRVAAKIPPLLRRRFQSRMSDRFREIHHPQRSRRRTCAAG